MTAKKDCLILYEDADRIIRNRSLADIDSDIKTYELIASENNNQYYQEMLRTLRFARDLAEFCLMNNIPTNEKTGRIPPVDYRIIQMMNSLKDIDGKATYTLKELQRHIETSNKKRTPSTSYIYKNILLEDDTTPTETEYRNKSSVNPATSAQHPATSQQAQQPQQEGDDLWT